MFLSKTNFFCRPCFFTHQNLIFLFNQKLFFSLKIGRAGAAAIVRHRTSAAPHSRRQDASARTPHPQGLWPAALPTPPQTPTCLLYTSTTSTVHSTNKLDEARVRDIVADAVEIECELSAHARRHGRMSRSCILFVADRLLMVMAPGCRNHPAGATSPTPWTGWSSSRCWASKTNFFEKRDSDLPEGLRHHVQQASTAATRPPTSPASRTSEL